MPQFLPGLNGIAGRYIFSHDLRLRGEALGLRLLVRVHLWFHFVQFTDTTADKKAWER